MNKKKIKILHIQETIGSGGVERRRLSIARHLDKNVFDQKFVCTFARGNIPDEIRNEGHSVISIGKLKSPLDWRQHKKVQKIIDEYKPDIIHGAVFEGVTMAAINGWIKKVPVILIEETSFPINRTWKANLLMKFFAKISDRVIGVSSAVSEEYLKEKLNLSEKKVSLINNGVALPRTITADDIINEKNKWGIKSDDFVIGSIGRMLDDSNKRFSDLIYAFAEFATDKKNVKLILVGDGKEKEVYENLVGELKISERVIFTGYQSDVTLFYRLMNIFSLVSTHESFGLVLAEAMLNKLPIIATKIGGMKYIVDDQETGFLVEPKNIKEISSKIQVFYQSPNLREEMGKKGYNKAIVEFTETVYVKKIEKLYLNALTEKKII